MAFANTSGPSAVGFKLGAIEGISVYLDTVVQQAPFASAQLMWQALEAAESASTMAGNRDSMSRNGRNNSSTAEGRGGGGDLDTLDIGSMTLRQRLSLSSAATSSRNLGSTTASIG